MRELRLAAVQASVAAAPSAAARSPALALPAGAYGLASGGASPRAPSVSASPRAPSMSSSPRAPSVSSSPRAPPLSQLEAFEAAQATRWAEPLPAYAATQPAAQPASPADTAYRAVYAAAHTSSYPPAQPAALYAPMHPAAYVAAYSASAPAPAPAIEPTPRVTEIVKEVHHHHHHHHYYEPVAAAGSPTPGAGSPMTGPGVSAPAAIKPAITVTARKKEGAPVAAAPPSPSTSSWTPSAAGESSASAAAAAAAPLNRAGAKAAAGSASASPNARAAPSPKAAPSGTLLKAQQLLQEAKLSEEVKQRRRSSASRATLAVITEAAQMPLPVVVMTEQSAAEVGGRVEAAPEAAHRRSRSRTASVVLSEVSIANVLGGLSAAEAEVESEAEKSSGATAEAEAKAASQRRPHSNSTGFVELAETMVGLTGRGTDEQGVETAGDDERGAAARAEGLAANNEAAAEVEVEAEEGPRSAAARSEALIELLEVAAAVEEEAKAAFPSLPLVSFGELVNQSRKLKSPMMRAESRLPKYASVREANPSRPPAQLGAPGEGAKARRHTRAASLGADLEPVRREGWLWKMPRQNRWLPSSEVWKKRWFRLTERTLMYMASPKDPPKRMLDLAAVEIVTDPKRLGRTPTPHAMALFGRGDTANAFRVCADSFADVLGWYRAVVNNAVLCSNMRPSLPPQDKTPLSKADAMERAERERKKGIPKAKMPAKDQFYPEYHNPATFYDLLGVPPDASKNVIRKRFYKLAAEFHPDKNPGVDPHEFAALAQAYDILHHDEQRARYDLGEEVKEVLRRGFDATCLLPSKWGVHDKRRVPIALEPARQTIFSDGQHLFIFYQPVAELDAAELPPLKPSLERCVELRWAQRVLFGRNDKVVHDLMLKPRLEQMIEALDHEPSEEEVNEMRRSIDCFMVISGGKLDFDFFVQLDSPQSCKKMVDGVRIIRCQASVLFAQTLEKMLAEGLD